MTPPDVLWRTRDGLWDDTARAWDARNLRPLTPPAANKPLAHKKGCLVAEWPDLAAVCPCTAQQRYQHRHSNHH